MARILHSCSDKEALPWHRVVNREGRIALGPYTGHALQRQLLEQEGVLFTMNGRIEFDQYLWVPHGTPII